LVNNNRYWGQIYVFFTTYPPLYHILFTIIQDIRSFFHQAMGPWIGSMEIFAIFALRDPNPL
jgi:hypothetical protein